MMVDCDMKRPFSRSTGDGLHGKQHRCVSFSVRTVACSGEFGTPTKQSPILFLETKPGRHSLS